MEDLIPEKIRINKMSKFISQESVLMGLDRVFLQAISPKQFWHEI